jgi:hypothetical protein
MNIQSITLAALVVFSTSSHSALQEREYNAWYAKNAVLYDMTQTSEGMPVMLSFSQSVVVQQICWFPIYLKELRRG